PIRVRFLESQKPAIDAVENFIDWMRRGPLPASSGRFGPGPEVFQKKVALEEGIDTPVDVLLTRGYELLHSTQETMKRGAADRPVKAFLRETARDHHPGGELLAYPQAMLDELKSWAPGLVAIPADAEV